MCAIGQLVVAAVVGSASEHDCIFCAVCVCVRRGGCDGEMALTGRYYDIM